MKGLKFKLRTKRKSKLPIILLFTVVLISLSVFSFLFLNLNFKKSPKAAPEGNFSELSQFKDSLSFKQMEDILISTARLKGAEYTFKLLATAPLPPNIDIHLLGHVVGDELYKQKGVKGIEVCTDQFRNACSHSIVIGIFSDQGEKALPQIADACKEAPGGSGAYTMCFHGLGHGILSALGYDLPKGVDTCLKIKKEGPQTREQIECVGGMIMEIVGGGDHDKNVWSNQRIKYLTDSDPLSPCDQSYIPQDAKEQCLNYLTPHFFELAGSDLANPDESIFKKAFPYCNGLDKDDSAGRFACYGGFGKEFVVLAQDRDIRKINQLNKDQIAKIYSWCSLADQPKGVPACIDTALTSVYWGGENNYHTSIDFCNYSQDHGYQQHCIENLFGMVHYYVTDPKYRTEFCDAVLDEYKQTCTNQLLN